MEQWKNKIAVVTGASSGIGAAIVKELIRAGIKTVGLARRIDRVEELKNNLTINESKLLYAYKCDVSDENSVKESFKWIENNVGFVNILINNAGVSRYNPLLIETDSNDDIQELVNTNLLGVLYCTREIYKHLTKSNDKGYIIFMNSLLGHSIPLLNTNSTPTYNIYPGTKYALTATTEVIQHELNYSKNSKLRITSLSPGFVATDMLHTTEIGKNILNQYPALQPEDISDAVLYILGTPSRVQIKELKIIARA